MARIKEYKAENVELRPVEAGYAAEELAGRRVGQFYTQTAEGEREAGNLKQQGDTEAGKIVDSFLRFSALEAKDSGITIKGGGRGLEGGFGGFGGEGGAGSQRDYQPASIARMGQMSNGGAGLSRIARQLIQQAMPSASVVDPQSGGAMLIDSRKIQTTDQLATQQEQFQNKTQEEQLKDIQEGKAPGLNSMPDPNNPQTTVGTFNPNPPGSTGNPLPGPTIPGAMMGTTDANGNPIPTSPSAGDNWFQSAAQWGLGLANTIYQDAAGTLSPDTTTPDTGGM